MNDDLFKYLTKEHIIIAAATYYFTTLLRKTAIKEKYIPFISTGFAIAAVFLNEITTINIRDGIEWVRLIYTSVIYGLVISLCEIYIRKAVKKIMQSKEKKRDNESSF